MLKGIGRWLRAAGYDTAIAQDGVADEDLLAQARAENRVLLTCDRALAGRAAPGAVVLLATESLDEAAAALRDDWRSTGCMRRSAVACWTTRCCGRLSPPRWPGCRRPRARVRGRLPSARTAAGSTGREVTSGGWPPDSGAGGRRRDAWRQEASSRNGLNRRALPVTVGWGKPR
jgi:hypothetical protein